jgi:hypothetical protein
MWCEILVRKREKSFIEEEDPNLEGGCKVATVRTTWAFSSPATVHDEGWKFQATENIYMREREREREREGERERDEKKSNSRVEKNL